MRFKVLEGAHVEGGRIWRKDEVVESKSDLGRHNRPPYSLKFEATTEPASEGRRLRGEEAPAAETPAPAKPVSPQQQQNKAAK